MRKPKRKTVRYKVLGNYINGWTDAGWMTNGRPWRFKTRRAAQKEIDDFIRSCRAARMPSYSEKDYKVVQA